MIVKIFPTILLFSFFIHSQNQGQPGITDNTAIQQKVDSLLSIPQEPNLIDLDESYQNSLEAYALSKSANDKLGLVKSQIKICQYYNGKKRYFDCIECFYEVLEIAKSYNFQWEVGVIYGHIGYNYVSLKRYRQAKEILDKAVEINTQTRNYNQKAYALCDLGRLNYQLGTYKQALTDYFLVINFFDSITDPRAKLHTYRGLGTVYFYKHQYTWALYYFNLAIALGIEYNLSPELGVLYTLKAHVYQSMNDIPQSLFFNKKALEIRTENDLSELKASSLVNIGTLFLDLNQLDSSEFYISQGINVLKSSEDYFLISYAYLQLFHLSMKKRDFTGAMKAFHQYQSLTDSLQSTTNKSEIELLETNYKIADFERKNELLLREIAIQKLQLKNRSYSELITQLIIGIIGVIMIITVYILERNKLGKSRLERINAQLNKEVDERRNTEIQLRTSEELYRFVTDHTLDLIVRMDRNFRYLYISPSILQMFGYSPEDVDMIPGIQDLIPENFRDELRIQFMEMIRLKEPVILTHQSIRKDGSLFWAESLVNPIFNQNTGKLRETITVIRNITDRVAYEESLSENARQKELLLREIHHRVKNNFAILVSLMNMQKVSSYPGDFKEFLTELQGRIRTMSLVHELLYRSHDIDYIHFGEYMGQLVSIISRAYNNKPVTIHTSIETCILDVETALPLGLISNEILTNAYKYAFNDQEEGELWIDVKRYDDGSNLNGDYSHTLIIRDNGPGLPEGFSPENLKTMGSQIITLLVDQLEGRLDVSGTDGATFTIYFSDEKRS